MSFTIAQPIIQQNVHYYAGPDYAATLISRRGRGLGLGQGREPERVGGRIHYGRRKK